MPLRGLVCLTPPQQSDPPCAARDSMVSELASWLHKNDWPVDMLPSSYHSRGAHVIAGQRAEIRKNMRWSDEDFLEARSPEILGMGYRLKRIAPWVVHAFDLTEAAAAQVANAPYVLSLRSVPRSENFTYRPYANHEFASAIKRAGAITVSSRTAQRRLLDTYGYEASVVREGVDTEQLISIPARRSRPLIVCPLIDVTVADLKVLVVSFLAAQAEVRDLQLALVGHLEPNVERQLMEMIPAELRGQVLVVDNADRRRFHALLARSFVTCMPSLSESSNRVLVESLALGTAVLCADGGAASEVIDEDAVDCGAGIRFAPGDESACKRGMVKLIERAGSEDTLTGCRTRASLYDWSFVGPNLVDLYRQAAAEN